MADSSNFEKEYLRAGVITTTHGIKGEVKVYPEVDDPGRFSLFKEVFLRKGDKLISVEIENVKFFKKMVIVKFKGIDDINDVVSYRDYEVMARREDIAELGEDQFFDADIIGLSVVDKEGKALGTVVSILHGAGNDVYVIRNEKDKEIMIPAVKQFILSVDIEGRRMVTDPLPGML
ncbi:MAG: ribosome maturation factor RimM [Lachnospiraceae bacterium]|nr:ribosome maturation factor RimM [Lachnospiraceae bacterium]